jgi:hypothetical protein
LSETKMAMVYTDRPGLPDSFADSVGAVHFDGALTKIELLSSWAGESTGESPTMRRYPSCRLVLTVPATLELHARLQQIIALMQQRGILREPSPAAAQGQTQK